MNRYNTAGVVADLTAGRNVLVVSETMAGSRVSFHDIAAAAERIDAAAVEVRRANGHEQIRLSTGGTARFLSFQQSPRGLSADVVYLDTDVTPDQLVELLVVVASPAGCEVIWR